MERVIKTIMDFFELGSIQDGHLPWQQEAEFISLALTVPSVGLSMLVCFLWGKAAIRAFLQRDESPTALFIKGVVAGFFGEVLDSLFWGFAWSLSFIDHPWRDEVFKSGVFFNIFFRQLLTMVAANFHVRSYIAHREQEGLSPETSWPVRMLLLHTSWASILLGLIYSLLLHSIR